MEIMRSTDPVALSYAEALLKGANINAVIFDQHMSVMEGSIGILPRRLLVAEGDWQDACILLREAGLETL